MKLEMILYGLQLRPYPEDALTMASLSESIDNFHHMLSKQARHTSQACLGCKYDAASVCVN